MLIFCVHFRSAGGISRLWSPTGASI